MRPINNFPLVCLLVTLAPALSVSRVWSDEGLEFFEARIRPVLVDHCYKCHSHDAEKLKGGLFLDSRDGMRAGGDTGPAIVPGDSEKSLLIEAIRYQNDDLEMPPKERLPAEVVADFEKWIALGAPDPRENLPGPAKRFRNVLYDPADAETHWAFQPIAKPAVPAIDDPWVRTPIDAFILRDLRAAGLAPSPPADDRILLRRLSYDLTGLPPAPDEVSDFEGAALRSSTGPSKPVGRSGKSEERAPIENRPSNIENLTDTLLASPQYGVHWGRHWLDIARYSDHTGLRPAPSAAAPTYPYAWSYRDWVINAFNEDMPWDRFVMAQIAGDRIGDPAGAGFCRVGKLFGQNIDDRTDDRIDAITKGFLGLTVTCARCHDHKFDPVTQADYFALHGIFMSSEESDVLVRDTAGTPQHNAYAAAREAVIENAMTEARAELNAYISAFIHQTADFLVATESFRDGALKETVPELAAREAGLQAIIFESWLLALAKWEKETEPAMTPWFAFAALPAEAFSEKASTITAEIGKGTIGGKPVDPFVTKAFLNSATPRSLRDVADIYEKLWIEMERAAGRRYPMTELIVNEQSLQRRWIPERYDPYAAAPEALPDPAMERLRQVMLGFEGPFGGPQMPPRMLLRTGARDVRLRINTALQRAIEIDGEHPGAPVMAMTFRDRDKPVDSPIHIRGDAKNPGNIVPRRFLDFLSGGETKPFTDGSGRLELANAIVASGNPLTARVIVNRVWQWHFGQGLVADASDFGLRCEPPTHPELLDWLATWFLENGGSFKKLHRLILASSTWRQASDPRPDGMERDPANTLLWRMNPRQLRFEELRDTLLAVSGRLDATVGGRPADPVTDIARRTAFLYVNRYELPDMFQTFDFATPDFSTAERESSIVPQQALFFMNAPWAIDRAADVAARLKTIEGGDAARISTAFTMVYQRDPAPEEIALAQQFLTSARADAAPSGELDEWSQLAQALLQTNEFVFVQ